MTRRSLVSVLAALVGPGLSPLFALKPERAVTQYTKTVWTQSQGLPNDEVSSIAQTSDGYLWVGTSDGLARFDGSEFVSFDNKHGSLPRNSVTAVAAGAGDELWIGTAGGLTRYKDGQFHTFTVDDGLPDNNVTAVASDRHGTVWLISGMYVSQFYNGKVHKRWRSARDLPLTSATNVYVDRDDGIWISGYGGVARFVNGEWMSEAEFKDHTDFAILSLLKDRKGSLWMGSYGLRVLAPNGHINEYAVPFGLGAIRSLKEDIDGNVWVGTTTGGLLRFQNGHFSSFPFTGSPEQGRVSCIYEDPDGDLWVGMNNGLYRFRDDPITIYSELEGLPSNTPTAVYQDRRGTLWVGFRDVGFITFNQAQFRAYKPEGTPRTEVFTIHGTAEGDILVSTLEGLERWHNGRLATYIPDRHFGRKFVFDAIEDRKGRTWVAYGGGLSELRRNEIFNVVPGGLLRSQYMWVLCADTGSALWAGTEGNGLWHVDGTKVTHFTTADGLSSDQIRALTLDSDGALWVGTLGGGLMTLRDGHFVHFSSDQGLLSDNIFHIQDDGRGSLWLSTSRGICRITKQQLADVATHKLSSLTPTNYTQKDGIVGVTGQSAFTADGRFWTPTREGLAVIDPSADTRPLSSPKTYVIGVNASGQNIDLNHEPHLAASTRSIEIRYAGVSISAPERIQFSYKLESLDADWILAGGRRTATYYNLKPGHYHFIVKAELPHALPSEAEYNFEILPYFYQEWWFRSCIVVAIVVSLVLGYQLHLRQLRSRFALVLEERSRLAREIHDTLAQGFVGISSQLEAVLMSIDCDVISARNHLELALGMAHYSLTEARRAITDLREKAVESRDLMSTLESEVTRWTNGTPICVHLDISNQNGDVRFCNDIQQHLLRITQEAVSNAIKHSSAKNLWIRTGTESQSFFLRIADDGRGFLPPDLTSPLGGHFGLIGIRERVDRIGGSFNLQTAVGQGTVLEIRVPLHEIKE